MGMAEAARRFAGMGADEADEADEEAAGLALGA